MATEQKLIDVNILLNIADRMEPEKPGYGRKHIDSKGLRYLVEKCPAADAVPVVHGRWIPYYEDVEIYNTGGFKERKQTGWICSRCKSKKSYTPHGNENYCPNCGAKMDGGTDNG